jgi:hypothetical protein
VAWPLAAHAQQPRRLRRIGALMNFTAAERSALGTNALEQSPQRESKRFTSEFHPIQKID